MADSVLHPKDAVEVPNLLAAGDYVLRYRGANLPLRGVLTGDLIVVADRQNAAAGALVVTTRDDGQAELVPYKDGLEVRGVVTGVMRRLP